MTIVGLDDTDSREHGMCTTFVGSHIADRLEDDGWAVERTLLVRLNPGIPHKTRGNAAVAVHTTAPPSIATHIADVAIEEYAAIDVGDANPGLVVLPASPTTIPEPLGRFTTRAIRNRLSIDETVGLCTDLGADMKRWGSGRGIVGALAAVGAWRSGTDWTVEEIAYRRPDRWGEPRSVSAASIRDAARAAYPDVWDTIDREGGDLACVPRTPCPVLYGIRGDDRGAVRRVAAAVDGEPVDRRHTFVTNQGTDAHLQPATLETIEDGRSYRIDATVAGAPETRTGGHVFVSLVDGGHRASAVAFEPTKRFRDHVRTLRPGDRVTVCGEVTDGTIKLEKFALRSPTTIERVTPTCPQCSRSMESAGRRAGYRCRDCGTAQSGPAIRRLERELAVGWYEVPPRARRHIAKPLIRGGFDAPVHPER